jgi:hypothetical protein
MSQTRSLCAKIRLSELLSFFQAHTHTSQTRHQTNIVSLGELVLIETSKIELNNIENFISVLLVTNIPIRKA